MPDSPPSVDDLPKSAGAVLLLGATGLIGSAIAAALHRDGWRVRAVVRRLDTASWRLPADELAVLDLRHALKSDDWQPLLERVAAVVNCAGVLQDSPRDSTSAVHDAAPGALFEACAAAGVRRVVHVSALGVEDQQPTLFSASKRRLEERLVASNLDWVILRPSVVLGSSAYGGSALFRGLASLPGLPRMPDAARMSVVQLDEVSETVVKMLEPSAPARVALNLAGPEALTFEEVVAHYRRWLGWRPARMLPAMPWLTRLAFLAGDAIGALGWRPPIRITALREIERGSVGDGRDWAELTGIRPLALGEALARRPASIQERWFARLFLLKPLALGIFAAFWFLTGLIALGPGYDSAVELMRQGGAGNLSGPIVIAGALADLAIAAGIAWRRTTRAALIAALALSAAYLACGTVLLPRLWEDPLGPMMKIWPILALNLMLLAILDER